MMSAYPNAAVFVGQQVFPPADDGGTFVILTPANDPNTILAVTSVFQAGLPEFNRFLSEFYERVDEKENMAMWETGGDLVRQYDGYTYRRL